MVDLTDQNKYQHIVQHLRTVEPEELMLSFSSALDKVDCEKVHREEIYSKSYQYSLFLLFMLLTLCRLGPSTSMLPVE